MASNLANGIIYDPGHNEFELEGITMDHGIGSWIPAQVLRRPTTTALVDSDSGRRLDYRQLDDRTTKLADAMRRRGIKKGDRVALLSLNCAEFFETLYAAAKLGAITVPINFRLSPDEVAYILADSGASMLVASQVFQELASAAVAGESVHVYSQVIVPNADTRRAGGPSEFEDLVATGGGEPIDADVAESDVCVLMYTSGTTGKPKGAMLTHSNMLWNAINTLSAADGLRRSDITIAAAPLFHIGALGVHCLPLFYAGGTSITQEAFIPDRMLALLAEEKVTVQFLVPAMWSAIASAPALESFELTHLRFAATGGAPCPLTLIEFFRDKGWSFLEGFGMTETAPSCHLLDPEHIVSKAGSIGKPLRHIEARIVDELEADVKVGDVGELVLRGPSISPGYWGLPDATAQAWRGGWFHTGDLARDDEDGYTTLVDRKKDMIISGGENVYPIEVEQVLYRHPHVTDVAVVGVPDSVWGEKIVAVVVTDGDDVPADDLMVWTRERLAHFKCPTRIEFIEALPRNATGKILKRSLRSTFSGSEHAVAR